MKKSICFAYFADDKFIGWYSDSFGTITKNCPKVYTDLETMKPIIEKNFNYKIEKLKEERDETAELIGNINPLGGLLIQQTVDSDKSKIGNSDNVELRVVECPIYDGPDPDFNEKEYKEKVKAQRDLMEKEGIFDIPAPSKERSDALNALKIGKQISLDEKDIEEKAIALADSQMYPKDTKEGFRWQALRLGYKQALKDLI